MITIWAFFFVGVLSLMLLGMIYGEKFSLNGLIEGRWLNPLGHTFSRFWSDLCQALDLTLQFVSDHMSWVVATVSGSIGLFIIAFLLFSGVADDAAATNRDLKSLIFAGGVIDQVPEIVTIQTHNSSLQTLVAEEETHLVRQAAGEYTVFSPPRPNRGYAGRRRRERIPEDDPILEPVPDVDQADLKVRIKRLPRGVRSPDTETETWSIGKLYQETPLPDLIDDALRRLIPDDWRKSLSSAVPGSGRNHIPLGDDLNSDAIPESSSAQVKALESQVRIIPGDGIAEHDIRVDKSFPAELSGGELTLEIAITNVGSGPITGLLVREFLPRDTRVRQAMPTPVLHADTLTWLLDELQPFDMQVIRFTVVPTLVSGRSSRRIQFESLTEVSAASAVTSRTLVRESVRRDPVSPPRRVNPLPEVPERRTTPEVARRPDLRLRIEEPVRSFAVGEPVEVKFRIRNVGTAPAEGVDLRVTLDRGLTHHTLSDTDQVREVINGVRRLEPGESRDLTLRMRISQPGEHRCTAEMVFAGESLLLERFRVLSEQKADPLPRDRSIR